MTRSKPSTGGDWAEPAPLGTTNNQATETPQEEEKKVKLSRKKVAEMTEEEIAHRHEYFKTYYENNKDKFKRKPKPENAEKKPRKPMKPREPKGEKTDKGEACTPRDTKEYYKKYYIENKEKMITQRKERYKRCREQEIERSRKYYENNTEKMKQCVKDWQQRKKEERQKELQELNELRAQLNELKNK